jgi:hypothetical protein
MPIELYYKHSSGRWSNLPLYFQYHNTGTVWQWFIFLVFYLFWDLIAGAYLLTTIISDRSAKFCLNSYSTQNSDCKEPDWLKVSWDNKKTAKVSHFVCCRLTLLYLVTVISDPAKVREKGVNHVWPPWIENLFEYELSTPRVHGFLNSPFKT